MFLVKFLILSLFVTFISSDECGISTIGAEFNVGGEYSEPGQWPWLASLFYKGKYGCGTSIISQTHLLTAAHCIISKGNRRQRSPADFHALLGRHDLDNNDETNFVQKQISEIFVHPDWKPREVSYDADVAVMVVASEIIFTDFIQPICLPSSSEGIFNVEGTVAGYGYSDTNSNLHENRPKHVKIKSVEHDVCLFEEHSFVKISSLRMFCAGEPGKNPCKGDSGSPFMVRLNNKWTINGIVSASTNRECHENDFVLFTQVPVFIDWIQGFNLYVGTKQEINGIQGIQENNAAINEHPLECEFTWSDEFKNYECLNYSYKILEPNQKVTSILGEIPDSMYDFSNIENIATNGAEISYLPDFSVANKKFPNFKRLFIVNAGLKELDKEMLALMPQLIVLNVFGNQIQEFQENVFDDLVHLEILAFVQNQIKVLPQKLLWNLPNLKEFAAWSNQIEAVPSRFFKNNKKIEEIWLSYNKIVKIGVVFIGLPKLNFVDLTDNVCISNQAHSNFDEFQDEIDEKCA